ncbi:MAG: carboxymuconolactone decarboxylase family protein [Acidobacteriales bacterium]|nr:carboxymuconolactone decarboxylase family protein [Terriglobales bacterium]
MNRIAIPTADQTSAASLPLLAAVHKQLGVVPNLMKLVGNSPAALEGYLSLNSALGKGTIGAKTGERIALAIAEINGCSYCLSAHTYLGKNVAKLDDAEIAANRDGTSSDPKAAAAIHFAARVALERGHVSDADVQAVKAAGYSNAEIVEIVLHVALNTLTNYVNEVAQTEIDFPHVKPGLRAAA